MGDTLRHTSLAELTLVGGTGSKLTGCQMDGNYMETIVNKSSLILLQTTLLIRHIPQVRGIATTSQAVLD